MLLHLDLSVKNTNISKKLTKLLEIYGVFCNFVSS